MNAQNLTMKQTFKFFLKKHGIPPCPEQLALTRAECAHLPNTSQLHPPLSRHSPTQLRPSSNPAYTVLPTHAAARGTFWNTNPQHLLLRNLQWILSLNTFRWPPEPSLGVPPGCPSLAGMRAALLGASTPCLSGFKCHFCKREAFSDPHWECLPGRAVPCSGLCPQYQMPSDSMKQEPQGVGSMVGAGCSGAHALNKGWPSKAPRRWRYSCLRHLRWPGDGGRGGPGCWAHLVEGGEVMDRRPRVTWFML